MDLYGALDLTPAATSADIERAFLRLARRYHPRINPGDRLAEERFRHVQQAYEVLGDPDRRHDYDRSLTQRHATVDTAIAFEGFDFSAPAQGHEAATFSEMFSDVFQDAARRATEPSRGGALELTMALSFDEAMRGGQFPVSVLRQERCHGCGGTGRVTVAPVACPACRGAGATRWARGHMVFTKPCEACGATGRLASQSCRPCAGIGVSARSEVVTLVIPPGIDDGARLAVPGRGHAGARGGTLGDLYVTIEVAPHAVFTRDGRDLRMLLPVAVHEAALGAKVEVPTLNGPRTVKIPPGTSTGTRLRVRGQGIPSAHDDDAGDLLVEVQIVLLPLRDERSKALMREFGALNPGDVRAHLFGTT